MVLMANLRQNGGIVSVVKRAGRLQALPQLTLLNPPAWVLWMSGHSVLWAGDRETAWGILVKGECTLSHLAAGHYVRQQSGRVICSGGNLQRIAASLLGALCGGSGGWVKGVVSVDLGACHPWHLITHQ